MDGFHSDGDEPRLGPLALSLVTMEMTGLRFAAAWLWPAKSDDSAGTEPHAKEARAMKESKSLLVLDVHAGERIAVAVSPGCAEQEEK